MRNTMLNKLPKGKKERKSELSKKQILPAYIPIYAKYGWKAEFMLNSKDKITFDKIKSTFR